MQVCIIVRLQVQLLQFSNLIPWTCWPSSLSFKFYRLWSWDHHFGSEQRWDEVGMGQRISIEVYGYYSWRFRYHRGSLLHLVFHLKIYETAKLRSLSWFAKKKCHADCALHKKYRFGLYVLTSITYVCLNSQLTSSTLTSLSPFTSKCTKMAAAL